MTCYENIRKKGEKKMFDKYVKVNEKRIIAGQTSQGIWYCKEVIAEKTNELKELINEINKIMNEYNKNTETKK